MTAACMVLAVDGGGSAGDCTLGVTFLRVVIVVGGGSEALERRGIRGLLAKEGE